MHPVRYSYNSNINQKEKKVNDLNGKHFLGLISPNVKGKEIVILFNMGEEYFKSKRFIFCYIWNNNNILY